MRILLFITILCSLLANTQEPLLYFEKINVQNGLSHNKVNCILQDKRGFTWLGTDDGLNRYDGKNFVHFRSIPGDTTCITGNIITDILEGKEGKIWIATTDGGICSYDYRLPPDKQFRQYKHDPRNRNSIPANAVNTLLEDQKGALWLGTSGKAVIRFNKKTERFYDVTQSGKTILDLCMDMEGLLWVGRQGNGIMKIDPVTLKTIEDKRYEDLYAKLPHVTVTALHKDKEGNMWFGSWDKMLYKWDIHSGKEEVFGLKESSGFQNDEVSVFAEDKWGRLWMGGRGKGLHLYDRNSNRFYNYTYNPSQEGSIADNRINCIFIDQQGRVWIGTNRGVSITNLQKQQFVQRFIKARKNTDITIYEFFEDDKDIIWIGTSQGLFFLFPDGSIKQQELFFKNNRLHVTSFFKDGDGTMYLGTNYSLFIYDQVSNKLSLLPNTDKDGVMNQIIESRVVSITKDHIEGRPVLLVLPYGHFMAYYDLQSKKWVSRLDSLDIVKTFNLKDNLIRKLYKSRNGSIWMATAKEGLAKWINNSLPKADYLKSDPADAHSINNNNVFDIAEDNKGNLWVSTYGGGLHYYDVGKDQFTRIAATNILVEGVQVDHRQNAWMISNGNIHKYEPINRAYTSYQLPDLEKTGGTRGKIFRDSKDNLYVSGTNFFISFHPDSITEIKNNPKVYLTDFRIFNRSFSHLLQEKEITLKYKDNYFTFEYTAPDYTPGSTIQYAYMLEGFDKDWVDASERNYISYSNLDGGEYIFKVRATNTPGTWSEEYASMKITVIPPFWKRPWFYVAFVAFLLLASYLVYRYRINELLKRQAIRNRIAQDLHDNVGSTLSSISVYSQVARIYQQQKKDNELSATLEKISDTSGEMISELNDTVWAINPRNDHMEVILQKMESFAKPLLVAQGIQFHMNTEPRITMLELDMENRKNFYLIFKEVINNAVKYASCKNVYVELLGQDNQVLIRIKDDGKGFDLSQTSEGFKSSDVYGGGNGLKNMQRRAQEMKGDLKIWSESQKGTTVELHFPIP
jgi:ligand-binding sensor domain-containing protein/two-component sensor histidine kinase